MSPTYRVVLASAVSCAFVATVAFAAEREIGIDQLPEAVKVTLEQQAQGAQVTEIELEDKDGTSTYTAELKKDGTEREIMIAPDGRYLGEEQADDDDKGEEHEQSKQDEEDEETAVQLSDAPAGVQAAIRDFRSGGTLKGVTSEKEHGVTVYEAAYDVNGKELSLKISSDGTLLEIERAVDENELPAAVTAAIQKKFPSGVVKKAETVEQHIIEVKIATDGKTQEVKFSPAGVISESEDED
jgi:uncharacterized membrane protein YkoI